MISSEPVSMTSGNSQATSSCDRIKGGKAYISTQPALEYQNSAFSLFGRVLTAVPNGSRAGRNSCKIMNLSREYNYIEPDAETRRNSTYRMPNGGLKAKSQIIGFVSLHTEILFSKESGWKRVSRID